MSVRRVLWLDLSVAVLLIVGWLSIPLATTHVALGVGFVVAVVVHLVAKRRRLRVGERHTWSRRHGATLILLALVAVMTTSGVAQWTGVAVGPMTALHAASSFGVFVLAGRHVWHRRNILRRRWILAAPRPVPGALR